MPGQMPATGDDWVKGPTKNGKGWNYTAPDGRNLRVVPPEAKQGYPNGYVEFTNSGNQPLNMSGKPGGRSTFHFPRNADGSFPYPTGWAW